MKQEKTCKAKDIWNDTLYVAVGENSKKNVESFVAKQTRRCKKQNKKLRDIAIIINAYHNGTNPEGVNNERMAIKAIEDILVEPFEEQTSFLETETTEKE